MAGPRRRNACEACVQAKRACDRQNPKCGRCAGRDIECRHPEFQRQNASRRARLAPKLAHDTTQEALPTEDEIQPVIAMSSNRPRPFQDDSALLDSFEMEFDADCAMKSILFTNCSAGQLRQDSTSTVTAATPSCDPSWFLGRAVWDVEHRTTAPPLLPFSLTKEFFKTFMVWLREWAATGRNPFIHPQLHRAGLPSCLQDAYTSIAAYLAKTEETEDMILRIIEDRASSLIKQFQLLEGIETIDLPTHLARTQALMVYTLIRLFDGCPRQRSLAEASLSTLRRWYDVLLDAAANEVPRFFEVLKGRSASESELKNSLWRAWILSESIRRTWLLASSAVAIYGVMKDDYAPCSGGLPFTVRKGLWEAKSASWWAREVQRNDPLLTTCGGALNVIKVISPDEVDPFAHNVLRVLIDPDELDEWHAKHTDT